jgi:hypothetical protein
MSHAQEKEPHHVGLTPALGFLCARLHPLGGATATDPHRPNVIQQLQQVAATSGSIATCATSYLLLEHQDETLATYVRK